MKLLAEAKDIQNEIDMVMHVLREQERLLTQLRDNIRSEFLTLKKLRKKATLEVTFDAQIENIKGIIERLVRMKQQAGEFYDSVSKPKVNANKADVWLSAINYLTSSRNMRVSSRRDILEYKLRHRYGKAILLWSSLL